MKKENPWLGQSSDSNCGVLFHFILAFLSISLLVSTALMPGCASRQASTSQQTQQKEAILQQCGFRAVPVRTPQQLQQIQTLPPARVSLVQRNGFRYYVFPDPAQQILYVGTQDEYSLYQNYLSVQGMNAELGSGNESFIGWDDPNWGSWDSK
jgi:hypothetical protein